MKLVVRLVVTLVVLGVGIAALLYYANETNSERVKQAILSVGDDLNLSPEERMAFEQVVSAAHEKAFAAASQTREKVGGMLNEQAYMAELRQALDQIGTQEGRAEMVNRIKGALEGIELKVRPQ